MRAEDIHDRESLWVWLEARPPETMQRDGVWLAFRAAARVFPLYARAANPLSLMWAPPWADLSALPLLRCLLTLGVAAALATPGDRIARYPTSLRKAGRAASSAATYAATYAAPEEAPLAGGSVTCSAALTAVRAAKRAVDAATTLPARATDGSASATASATASVEASARADTIATSAFDAAATAAGYAMVRADALALAQSKGLPAIPLWFDLPNWFPEAEQATLALWTQGRADKWDFWRRWWGGVLEGQSLPWDLQEKISLIPAALWKQGAEALALEIARVEAGHP